MLPWQPIFGFRWAICMIAIAPHCLILGVGFQGQAIRWRHSRDRVSKGHWHGNQFLVAITGFVWTIATRQLVMNDGSLSGQPTKCRHCRYPATKGRYHGNHFYLSTYGVYIGATWRIQLNRPCAAAMRAYIKLLWPLVTIAIFTNTKLLRGIE